MSKWAKHKTAQNPVMVRPKKVLRSNILKTIKTNNKAFSRSQKPTGEPIKLKDDQGVQGGAKNGKATAKQLVFAGIVTAEGNLFPFVLIDSCSFTWWHYEEWGSPSCPPPATRYLNTLLNPWEPSLSFLSLSSYDTCFNPLIIGKTLQLKQ